MLVCPVGIEPTTYGLEVRCSIQLSYEHILKRTNDRRNTLKNLQALFHQ